MTHATPGSVERIQDIERLRAIAALGVLVGHVPWLREGIRRLLGFPLDPWTGVDLFFVISGFVVSTAFERDLVRASGPGAAGVALRAFYLKRTARILPTAYLALVLYWLGATWARVSGTWSAAPAGPDTAATMASGLLLISNYTEIYAGITLPLFWYWSVCVEEHFYLLYPAARLGARSLWARAALVTAVFALVHVARLAVTEHVALVILSHLRFDQLALGVLLGLAHRRWAATVANAAQRLRARGWPRRVATAMLAGLLLVLGTLPVTWLVDLTSAEGRAGYVLAGLCALGIVALASFDADLLAGGRGGGAGRVLSAIGARSYGLYMYHMPALWTVEELWFRLFKAPRAPWLHLPELVAYLAVLAIMVGANYRWIEQPAIRWAHRRQQRIR